MNHQQLLRKAMVMLNQGKLGPARAICRKLLQQAPNDFNSNHLYGLLQLKPGDHRKACEVLNRAITLTRSDVYRAQTLSS